MPRKSKGPELATPVLSHRDNLFLAMDRLLQRVQKQFGPFTANQALVADISALRSLTSPEVDAILKGVPKPTQDEDRSLVH